MISCQDVSKMENFVVFPIFTGNYINFQMGQRKGEICPQDPSSWDGGRAEEVQCPEEAEGGSASSCQLSKVDNVWQSTYQVSNK